MPLIQYPGWMAPPFGYETVNLGDYSGFEFVPDPVTLLSQEDPPYFESEFSPPFGYEEVNLGDYAGLEFFPDPALSQEDEWLLFDAAMEPWFDQLISAPDAEVSYRMDGDDDFLGGADGGMEPWSSVSALHTLTLLGVGG